MFPRRNLTRSISQSALACIITVGVGAYGLTGCRDNHQVNPEAGSVKIINAVANSDSVRISEDSNAFIDKIGFGEDSGYKDVDPGVYDFGAAITNSQGESVNIYPIKQVIEKGHHYVAIAFGKLVNQQGVKINTINVGSQTDTTQTDHATVSVFDASPDADNLDILVNSIVAFKNVSLGASTAEIPLAALPYEWSVNPAGDADDQLISPQTIKLDNGKSYIVVIMGSAKDHTLAIKAFEE